MTATIGIFKVQDENLDMEVEQPELEVGNVDRDDPDFVTVYFNNSNWYLILTQDAINKIKSV